ncbi:MAG: DMT family transporter, partial [Rhizobacter sp.]
WPLLLLGALAATALGWAGVPSVDGLQLSWHALLYVGLVSSAIAVLVFNHGVRVLGPVTATAFLNFVPVSVLLMSFALGKPPALNELVGMAMVIAALLIHTATSRPAPAPIREVPDTPAHRNACPASPCATSFNRCRSARSPLPTASSSRRCASTRRSRARRPIGT